MVMCLVAQQDSCGSDYRIDSDYDSELDGRRLLKKEDEDGLKL
jgi:hypothetical protein